MLSVASFRLASLLVLGLSFSAGAEQSGSWNLKSPAQFNWSSERRMDKGIAKGDPLIATWAAWTEFAISGNLDHAKANADKIVSTWNLGETKKLIYKYQYNSLAPGWWSSMDSLFFPLFLLQVYGDNEDEIDLAREMVDRALKSPVEGGSLWPDEGDGCFFSEYSWPTINSGEEYYVMNGHLFSLTALKLIADRFPHHPNYANAFECAVRGTKSRAGQFFDENGWPLYQLVPRTINMPHYVLYESMQFGDLWEATGDQFFLEQQRARQRALEERYPVYLVSRGKERVLFFSGVGAPHPYSPDLFLNSVVCFDKRSRRIDLKAINTDGLPKSRFLVSEKISSKIKRCDVYATTSGGVTALIFSTSKIQEITDQAARELQFSSAGMFDAVAINSDSHEFLIDPSRRYSKEDESSYLDVEGRLVISIPGVILEKARMFAIELQSDVEVQIGLILWQNDKAIARYYRPLLNSRQNIVIALPLGFDGSEGIRAVDKIGVVIYTDRLSTVAHIQVKNVRLVENLYQLFQLLSAGGKINFAD
jgi:hypothetical protein